MKNIMNTMNLVKKAQEVQSEIAAIQKQLGEQAVTGSASNGAVQVTMTGKMLPQAVKIKPELLTQVDSETLEDLVLVALKYAKNKADTLMDEAFKELKKRYNLPDNFDMFS